VRRADLPGGERTPSLEVVCLLCKRLREARPSFALKPGDVVDGQGRDLVATLVATAPAAAFGHNWPGSAEAWVFYFQPDEPLSKKLKISVRVRSGLTPETMDDYFRLFKFRVKTPKPPMPKGTHTPLARQTKRGITLTIEDCTRLSGLYLVWTTVRAPGQQGVEIQKRAVAAWDSNGRKLGAFPGSPMLSDPPRQYWKRDGSLPATDEVAQKFFFLQEDAPAESLKLQFQCSGDGPAFVFDSVPVRDE